MDQSWGEATIKTIAFTGSAAVNLQKGAAVPHLRHEGEELEYPARRI